MTRKDVEEILEPFCRDCFLMWGQDMSQNGYDIANKLFSMSDEEYRQWKESLYPPGVKEAFDTAKDLLEKLLKESEND